MFDLEAAVSAWRREFQGAAAATLADLDELEDHLREDFAALVSAGHAEPDAWRRAQSRLGAPREIAREFARSVHLSTLDRSVFALVFAVVALTIVGLVALVCLRTPEHVAPRLLTAHVVTVTFGYVCGLAAAALATYVAIKGLIAGPPAPRLSDVALKSVRVASLAAALFTVIGFVLGAAWLNAADGRPFDGDPRELGAIAVVVCFLATLAISCRRAASPAVILALAIAGGGIVLASWFAARPEDAGGRPLFRAVGFGGLAACLVLAALALKSRRNESATIYE
jgi:hypothetical protein